MSVDERIRGIDHFWTQQFAWYLNQHKNPRNRATHMIGIPVLILSAIAALWTLDWRMFLGGQLLGWAIQIAGHKIEGNRPALFADPIAFLMGPLMVLVEMGDMLGLHFAFADRARRVVFGSGEPG